MKLQKRVLLAEDDDLLASLLAYRLEKAGYAVKLAHNGKEVKECLQQEIPDIIICDVMMPYYSGVEVAAFLRNELESAIPMILISSVDKKENIQLALELGASEYMTKPINPAALLERIAYTVNEGS
jgi:DNA-binding response OmpR family regulator